MKRKKRRGDIQKLVTASRDVWRQSEYYHLVKSACKDPNRKGFFICDKCRDSREVIKIDHIEPIGKQPDNFLEFGEWLEKLFNSQQQGLCADCHTEKTKKERL